MGSQVLMLIGCLMSLGTLLAVGEPVYLIVRAKINEAAVSTSSSDRALAVDKIISERSNWDNRFDYKEEKILYNLSNLKNYVNRCDRDATRALQRARNMLSKFSKSDYTWMTTSLDDPIQSVFYFYMEQNRKHCCQLIPNMLKTKVDHNLSHEEARKLSAILGGIKELMVEIGDTCKQSSQKSDYDECRAQFKPKSSTILATFMVEQFGTEKLAKIKAKATANVNMVPYEETLKELLEPICGHYNEVFKTEIDLIKANGLNELITDTYDYDGVIKTINSCGQTMKMISLFADETRLAIGQALGDSDPK